MKKITFAATALAAGCAFASITSSDVVGYQKYSLNEAGLCNVGAAFTPVNETGKWTCDTKVFDTAATGGDTIYSLDPVVFDFNTFMFNGYDGETSLGWYVVVMDQETFEPVDLPTAQSFELEKSQVVYFQASDMVTAPVVSGRVDDIANAQTVVIEKTMTPCEIANPYPKDTTLADLATFCVPGDTIYVLDTYWFDFKTYFYNGNGSWLVYDFNGDGELVDTVVTNGSTVVLPAGQGGYFQAADENGRTWTVTL